MAQTTLEGRSFLIITHDIETALPIQDCIVQAGGSVLTAYSAMRAHSLAATATLSDVIVDKTFDDASRIVEILGVRKLPYSYVTGQVTKHRNSVQAPHVAE